MRKTDASKLPLALILLATCLIMTPQVVFGQASAKVATATPVLKSTARGSSVSIRQNQLNIYKANLERRLRVAQRCVNISRMPVLLRDPQGNVNQVPKNDIVFCAKEVKILGLQIAAINRELADLSRDGQAAANYLTRKANEAAIAKRLGLDSLTSSE